MSDIEQVAALPKGVAPIKREFLVPVKDKAINWHHVAGVEVEEENKQEKKGGNDEPSSDGDEPDTKRAKTDDRDLPGNPKKFRLRGQNKNKLRYKLGKRNVQMSAYSNDGNGENDNFRFKLDKSKRLCLRLSDSNGVCSYGNECDYSHNLYEIHKLNKDRVINEPCYIYTTYGRCKFGAACRFQKDHLFVLDNQEKAYNLIDHKNWSCKGGREAHADRFINGLENSIQNRLRKKTYDFKIVNQVMDKLYKADIGDRAEQNDDNQVEQKRIGAAIIDDFIKSRDFQKKRIDFKNKLFLAPLTTVGNLPFRRLCKKLGADITCAEMSLCSSLLNGNPAEWSHLKRHESEDIFGVQITANHPEAAVKVVKVLNDQCEIDFVDFNCGCPTEWICQSGAGAGLMQRQSKMRKMIAGSCMVSKVPITVKMRAGCSEDKNIAHNIVRSIINPFSSRHIGAVTVHGRSRNQRYTKLADWNYINQCGQELDEDIALYGSGDCIAWQEYYRLLEDYDRVSGVMIARGALMSPWLFTEIKERRTWDITSSERLDMIRQYVNYSLDHWGSDATGVETCRRYLLEWLSFGCRYIPVGLLEVLPQKINERPPEYKGRDDMETLLASPSASDWVKISEMFLGKVPDNFTFLPKHKANAYESITEG